MREVTAIRVHCWPFDVIDGTPNLGVTLFARLDDGYEVEGSTEGYGGTIALGSVPQSSDELREMVQQSVLAGRAVFDPVIEEMPLWRAVVSALREGGIETTAAALAALPHEITLDDKLAADLG